MNAATQKRSIGFEENKMTAVRDGADQMRNAGMIERFASTDPNNRRAAGDNFANLFVRNRMARIGMQNFCRIHELDGACVLRKTKLLREAGHDQVRSKPEGKAHHAL
jgi:hypothetical protein